MIIQLTDNFSIAPEIEDSNGFALYEEGEGNIAHGWMNGDIAKFNDGDDFTVQLDKQNRTIALTNVSKNTSKSINY